MSKFGRGKRLIVLLLCLMFVALVSFSALFFNFTNKVKESNDKTTSAAVIDYSTLSSDEIYDFSRGRFESDDDEDYINYQYFSISNYEELLEFSISVAEGCEFMETNNRIITRKTIFLTNDIDASAEGDKKNANWQPIGSSMDGTKYKGAKPFSGVFDGCSYTIKNLTCGVDELSLLSGDPRLGFVSIGAECTIKNLKLENTKYRIAEGENVVLGLIGEGASRVNIQNCIISGLEVKITKETSNTPYYICGFLGCMGAYTYLSVKDCILKDVVVNYPEINGYVRVYKYGPAYEEATFSDRFGDLTIRLDEFMALEGFSKIERWTSDVLNVEIDVDTDIFTADYYINDEHKGSAEFASNHCYDTKDTAKTGLSGFDAWYVPPSDEFNEGWPYLKSFINFETYTFNAGENGTVSGLENGTISIPDEISVSIPNSEKFEVYGSLINAIPNIGYVFDSWTKDGNTFTANFKILPIQVNLNPIKLEHYLDGEVYYFRATSNYQDGNKNENEVFSPGTISINQQLQMMYGSTTNNISFINSNEGWLGSYWIHREEGNEYIDIWKMYTLDEFKINGIVANDLLNTNKTLEQILKALDSLDWNDLMENGLNIDISFKLKSYGFEVG